MTRQMKEVLVNTLFPHWTDTLDGGEGFGDATFKIYAEPNELTPKVDPYFVAPQGPTLEIMCILEKPVRNNVFVFGPSGCGKTKLLRHLAAIMNERLYEINGSSELKPSSLFGGLRVRKGDVYFEEGIVTKWLRTGGLLLINEYDTLDPYTTNALKPVLEDDRRVVLDMNGGEIVHGHPECRFAVTNNTKGRGDDSGMFVNVEVQSVADIRRFHGFVENDYITADEELKVLRGMFPDAAKIDDAKEDKQRVLPKFVDVANKSRAAFKKQAIGRVISTAELINWVENRTRFSTPHHAARISFLNSYESSDKPTVREYINEAFGQEDSYVLDDQTIAARASAKSPDA